MWFSFNPQRTFAATQLSCAGAPPASPEGAPALFVLTDRGQSHAWRLNMDAISILMDEHADVEDLFSRYQAASGMRQKRAIGDQLITALSVHTWVEERVVYGPAAGRSEALLWRVLDEVAEHQRLRTMLTELAYVATGPGPIEEREAQLDEAIATLRAMVQTHVEDEERLLYPELCGLLTADELDRIGRAMMKEREFAPTRPGSRLFRTAHRTLEIGRGLVGAAGMLTRGLLGRTR